MVPLISKSLSACAALVLALGFSSHPSSAQTEAEFGQALAGQAMAQADLIRQLRETGQVMQDYAKTHDHFPNTTAEFDDCLKSLYKKVGMTDPNSTAQVQPNGKYRTFYHFAIGVDSSYKSIPIINGVAKLPDYFTAPGPGMIVITTDGDDGCVGWISGPDNKPLASSGQNPLYFEASIPRKDETSK